MRTHRRASLRLKESTRHLSQSFRGHPLPIPSQSFCVRWKDQFTNQQRNSDLSIRGHILCTYMNRGTRSNLPRLISSSNQ
eukprot:scaffold1601_cov140-Skeletonema_marinoi.AAC.10